MKTKINYNCMIMSCFLAVSFLVNPVQSQKLKQNPELDAKVKKFLDSHANQWHDMNVPALDGQLLHGLIIKNRYKNALEIGTSTGHSAIWIAWALSKTGGKLITIEINERRFNQLQKSVK